MASCIMVYFSDLIEKLTNAWKLIILKAPFWYSTVSDINNISVDMPLTRPEKRKITLHPLSSPEVLVERISQEDIGNPQSNHRQVWNMGV